MNGKYNHAAIRELIEAALSDEDLKKICFDHFNEVYASFTAGQTRGERILFLVEHVGRQGREAKLIKEIREKNPHQYLKFKSRFGKTSPDFQISVDSPRFAPLMALATIAFISLLMTVILVGCFPIERQKLEFSQILLGILTVSGVCIGIMLVLSKIYIRWFVIVLIAIPLCTMSTVTTAAYLLDMHVYEIVFGIVEKIVSLGEDEIPEIPSEETDVTDGKPETVTGYKPTDRKPKPTPVITEPETSSKPTVKSEPVSDTGKSHHVVKPESHSSRFVSRKKSLFRDEPTELSDDDVAEMIEEWGFFSNDWISFSKKWANESGNFENDFEDNEDGTVTDHATGLMWQQSGSDKYMKFEDVPAYVKKINRERLGGHDDWRLPTLEELASLLESEKKSGGLYIDPVFNNEQIWCWSSDKRAGGGVWDVYFGNGLVYRDYENDGNYVRLVRRGQ